MGDTNNEKKYEDAAKLTGFDTEVIAPGAGWLDRHRTMAILSLAFVVIIGGGMLLNLSRNAKKSRSAENSARAARGIPSDFRDQRDRAGREERAPGEGPETLPEDEGLPGAVVDDNPDSPAGRLYRNQGTPAAAAAAAPPPPAGSRGAGGSSGSAPVNTAFRSPLVPNVEGSLLGGRAAAPQAPAGSYAQQYPYRSPQDAGQDAAAAYLQQALAAQQAAQAAQAAPGSPYLPAAQAAGQGSAAQNFSGGQTGGTVSGGVFLRDNALWIGTVIPGILVTGINTDLPGEVIARVTENIYDSLTGKNLLI
ncbi:MAG: hypothetical protein LBS64_01505, partial [Spirochaetaceae bacterium]|nr:hypothetical protein [Spirochaetaceae bacterium]